ncbi:response regulator [Pedobacter nyackensis]|uniref:response regulator n=1 Tax=Pedobacter nyackensis TaxID=475255 RepID=UPI0029319993|nr:response regulator [Pedobacter nyackensis]
MFISRLCQSLNDIPISKKLYFIFGTIILWMVAGLCAFLFSKVVVTILTLSAGSMAVLVLVSIIRSFERIERTNSLSGHAEIVRGDQNLNEVDALRISLAKEQQRAEHYERAKQYFLVNMSHEIRTPMNAILGFGRYLQRSLKDPEDLDSVKMIIKSGEHLLTTLNDILDFVNIDAGEISFVCSPFNLKDTVQSIFMLKESEAKIKQIEISYSIDPEIPGVIYGDSVRLTQILLSLTSNAIKFTEEGGVFISAVLVSDHDDHVIVEFSVQDTGIGIDLDMQEKIFSPFEQGTNHMKRKFGGTGIGLSIVKHLIALQDGVIQLKSKPGEGSEFYFRLPFLKAHAGKDLTKSQNKVHGLAEGAEIEKEVSILIVEDNKINQLLVIKLLEQRGYQTTVAENGKIALHKYSHTDFDIILMDLQMPEMDGYETTVHIRNMTSHKKDIPIVAMTAHTIKGEREKCLAIGMNDYISKPFHAEELYEKINMLINTLV